MAPTLQKAHFHNPLSKNPVAATIIRNRPLLYHRVFHGTDTLQKLIFEGSVASVAWNILKPLKKLAVINCTATSITNMIF